MILSSLSSAIRASANANTPASDGSPRGRAEGDATPDEGGASAEARPRGETAQSDELSLAKTRIAELERVIGRQQADLHFFREALRLMDATPPSGIATKSTRSSKR